MYYTKEEALEFIAENDVKFVKLSFCDAYGKLKNISLLASHISDAFENGICFDAASVEGFGNVESSSLFLFPVPETLNLLPWRPSHGRVARFMCNIKYADGRDFELDIRNLLVRADAEARKNGVLLNLRAESEFYLFKTDENGMPTNIPVDNAGYLDAAPADKGENVRRDICLTLEEMGIIPEYSHHEAGPGQHEIDFRYGAPLTSADDVMTFRNVVSSVASKYGLWASFDPKPLQYKPGNGFHINFSVLDSKLQPDKRTGKAFMAGILSHIREITAFLNPTEESYLRFGTFKSPSRVGYSEKSHSELISLPPLSAKNGTTGESFKIRSADSSANPYLVYTLLIYAGLDGIKKQTELPEELNADIYEVPASAAEALYPLPSTLAEASATARTSEFVKTALPDGLADRILDIYTSENS